MDDESEAMEEGEVDVGAQTDETKANGQGTDAQQVNHPRSNPHGGGTRTKIRKAWQFVPFAGWVYEATFPVVLTSPPPPSQDPVQGGPRAVQAAHAGPSNLGPQTLLGSGKRTPATARMLLAKHHDQHLQVRFTRGFFYLLTPGLLPFFC